MKLRFSGIITTLLLYGCGTSEVKLPATRESPTAVQEPHVNYGYNIVIAIDMSNRIKNARRYDDPVILKLLTDNLRAAFRKGLDVGIKSKFSLVTVNPEDFMNENYVDSIFKIDLTKFNSNAAIADYLYHNKGKNSLEYDLHLLNTSFARFYQNRRNGHQLPADMWYFLQDKLCYPLLDSSAFQYTYHNRSFVNRYKNYVIILTDGYIEAGRYGENPDMKFKNKYRFLSEREVGRFRNKSRRDNSSVAEYFGQENYGIMPVSNALIKDCKFLVLEMFDRSIVNGVSTMTPRDQEIIKLFWNDWFVKSGALTRNVKLVETKSSTSEIATTIKEFLEIQSHGMN